MTHQKDQCGKEYGFEDFHFSWYASEIVIGADHQIDNNACYRNIKPNRISKFNDFSVFGPLVCISVVICQQDRKKGYRRQYNMGNEDEVINWPYPALPPERRTFGGGMVDHI